MKENELRIGNFVTVDNIVHDSIKDIPLIVNSITESNQYYYSIGLIHPEEKTETNKYFQRYHQKNEFLKPIPLTEEWLLKLGYTYSPSCHYWIKGHLIWKPADMLVCDKNGIVLKYVHQLQNLYFALTGEELCLKKE